MKNSSEKVLFSWVKVMSGAGNRQEKGNEVMEEEKPGEKSWWRLFVVWNADDEGKKDNSGGGGDVGDVGGG